MLLERLTGAVYATRAALTAEEQLSQDKVRAALLDTYMPSWAEAYEEFQARKLRPGETVEEYLQALRGSAALKSLVPEANTSTGKYVVRFPCFVAPPVCVLLY